MADRIIDLLNIHKAFDDTVVLDDVSLYVRRREFLTLLGPSGCGKTTMLRLIAGFEKPDAGDILFEGKRINDLPPYQRRVNTVFQQYSLFPHLNVFDNVAFGLHLKKVDKHTVQQSVEEMLGLVGLEGFERRKVDSLSGGQQQRVAIARALVNRPEVLLLDEPLAALDLKLRKSMQLELKRMQQQLGITFVFVTHDQEEALTMSDTIAVMNHGKILQIGTPVDIYNEPINNFVADFIGESNLITGVMVEDYHCSFAGREYTCVDTGFARNERVDIVIRPEDVDILPRGQRDDNVLPGVVESILFMGVHFQIVVHTQNGHEFMVHTTDATAPGTEVDIYIEPDAIHIMKQSDMPLASEEEPEGVAIEA